MNEIVAHDRVDVVARAVTGAVSAVLVHDHAECVVKLQRRRILFIAEHRGIGVADHVPAGGKQGRKGFDPPVFLKSRRKIVHIHGTGFSVIEGMHIAEIAVRRIVQARLRGKRVIRRRIPVHGTVALGDKANRFPCRDRDPIGMKDSRFVDNRFFHERRPAVLDAHRHGVPGQKLRVPVKQDLPVRGSDKGTDRGGYTRRHFPTPEGGSAARPHTVFADHIHIGAVRGVLIAVAVVALLRVFRVSERSAVNRLSGKRRGLLCRIPVQVCVVDRFGVIRPRGAFRFLRCFAGAPRK